MSLKWEKILDDICLADDVLYFVKDLFTNYDKDTLAPAYHYIGQKLLKHAHSEMSNNSESSEEWVNVVVYLVMLLAHNEDMVNFLCKLGPHIIIAVHNKGSCEDLLTVSQALHPTFIKTLKATPAAHIFDVLWRSSISSHKEEPSQFMEEVRIETRLQVLALQYLIMTDNQLDLLGPKASAAVRNMTSFERQYHTSTVWDCMLTALERMAQSGLVRIAELIFSLPRLNYEDTGDLSQLCALCDLLPHYSVYLSALKVEPLFRIIVSCVNNLQVNNHSVSVWEGVKGVEVKELLMSEDKDIRWICLCSARLLSALLLHFNTLTLNILSLIYQVSKLLLRSPQSGSVESISLLLSHTHSTALPLYDTEPTAVFGEHRGLLQLHILALTKAGNNPVAVTKAGNNPVGYTREELLNILMIISEKLPASLQLSCVQLSELLPCYSVKFCLYHSHILKKQGFLTDACNTLVKALSLPNNEDILRCRVQHAICLIMKLEVEEALQILTNCDIEGLQTPHSAACKILTIYCKWVTAIKKDQQYQFPPATQFCKEVHTLLNSCDPAVIGGELSCDPCLISLSSMLCGLYGLPGVLVQCSEYLEPSNATVNTMLCVVPSLVLAGQGVNESWQLYEDISLFVEGPSKEMLEEHSSNNLLSSVIANYLLIDFKLAASEQVYDCSYQSVIQCLDAAHVKIKNFKKLPAKVLLWKGCCVLPLLLQIMERYIRLLNLWGSLHTALTYLDTFEQLANFLHSNYWQRVHSNLLALVYMSLGEETKATKALTKINAVSTCPNMSKHAQVVPTCPDLFMMECNDVEQELNLELKVLMKEIQRRSDDDKENSLEVELPKSLPLRSILKLQLLKTLWCHDNQIFPHHLRTIGEDSCYIDQESFKLLNALLSLEYIQHPSLPPPLKPAPAKRRGRKPAKQKQAPSNIDHLGTGLVSCEGLYPVIVMRVLLSEQLKTDPTWSAVQQYHALPLQHQLHNGLPKPSPETLPGSWSVASITKLEDTLYIGRQSGKDAVLFKRDLPYTIKSCGISHFSCTDEMDSIIRSNDTSIEITDKVEFWKSRFLLDKNLASLLVRLQNEWLGPWRGLLLGMSTAPDYGTDLRKRAASLRKVLKSKYKITITNFLSEYILDSYSILSDEEVTDLLSSSSSTPPILSLIHDMAPPPTPARHPSLLCLGNGTECLPWEACPVYSSQTICRVPSLDFVLKVKTLRTLPILLDEHETFYMLNPRNDLPSTQSLFQSWLEAQDWKGVVAKPPSIKDYQDALNAHLFLYLGHGSGKEFLKGKSIQEFNSRAVALLMGCSSGRLKSTPVGTLGTPIEYLLSGCPAVVGYLWNVTDRDCDRFSKRLLELWLEQGSFSTLPSLVNPSRDVCKLKYLVGAAPVVYGVPDILTG